MNNFDSILLPIFMLKKTNKFYIIDYNNDINHLNDTKYNVIVDLNCKYSLDIAIVALNRRSWCNIINSDDIKNVDTNIIQICDFENIVWEPVMEGKHRASSYLIRKGLSRKAQLALQIRRYQSKHPNSILCKSVPYTVVIETWNAFEEMKLDFGHGTFASFDTATVLNAPLSKRLEWCLDDIKEIIESNDKKDWYWILKPSVTNKGTDIVVIKTWDDVIENLELVPDIREWVLQRYIERPLLIKGHKFHLRVYILCIGALKVYVFENILMLLAAHKYKLDDLDDIYRHLTNTARSAENIDFDESKFILLLDDLAYIIHQQNSSKYDYNKALEIVDKIRVDIRMIVKDLFSAFENEYTIFSPMSNCFELFGLDFLIDEDFNVTLLEVNPGPDFKQTGERLRKVIVELWEQTVSLIVDNNSHTNDFTLVYDNELSVSSIKGGLKFQ